MKRYGYFLIIVIVLVIILSSCSTKPQNLVFNATIDEIYEKSLLVNTNDEVGFDKASVSLMEVKGELPSLAEGDEIMLEILPEIMESYPVQVTAVKVTLLNKSENKSENDDLDKESRDEEEDGKTVEDEVIKVAEYRRISAEEAMDMMTEDSVILDVRTAEEYAEGHIPGAILIPDYELQTRAYDELLDMDQTILVYCRSGNRSMHASMALLDLGYTEVYDFGGIIDWPGEIVREDGN